MSHTLTSKSSLLLAFCLLLPCAAQAAALETSSHVTEATIYTDRALVTREAKIHVPAGVHTISVTDMPAGLNEATVRVQGKADAPVKIGTVEVKHEYLTELANAAEREKAAQIDSKTDQKTLIQGEIEAIKAKQDFIKSVTMAGADKHDPNNVTKLDFTPEKWAQAWNLLQTGMNETNKDIAARQIAARKLDNEIAALQEELNRLQSQQAKERRAARVTIDSAGETDLTLVLTYQTSGARWRPVYDARLDTGSGQLELEQYGQVTQSTGEAWTNVALRLSTAQPASGSEMPRLSEWWVRIVQPYLQRPVAMAQAGRMASLKDNLMQMQSAMPTPPPPPKMVEDKPLLVAEQVEAQAETSEYSAEFKVPGTVDLKSTQDMTKLYLGSVKMKAALAVQTAPRLNPQAYLFAKVTNGESYPLIPGAVAKYRDGSFIGNASLALMRPNETANFSFGADDRVKVEYKLITDKQDNPALLMSNMTIERQYQTKVQNLHKEPILVTVFDQYPVSSEADVQTSLLEDETTAGFVKDTDNRQGVLTWSASYQPKEEKIYTIAFRVKYPKGKIVTGM